MVLPLNPWIWLRSYLLENNTTQYVYNYLFKQEFIYVLWVLIIFGFYTAIKYILLTILPHFKPSLLGDKQLTRECSIALGIWGLIAFVLSRSLDAKTSIAWCETLLFGIIVYWNSSHHIVPQVIAKGQDLGYFLRKLGVLLIISCVPISIFLLRLFHRTETAFIITFFNFSIGVIAGILSWFLFHSRLDKNIELHGLKTELGRSSANLDFLRSQINPHFLFNALNTLYGTSLQENAERTGEGIQKLGDMMRFMLQENVQEKISLAREVDYLNNYIDLQKLRTQTSPDILIQTEIDTEVTGLQIAPMLLIPFVENAFKHGISLREPSHIKVSLQTREKELLFDVYNSIHPKTGNDPEKDKSGIGLENVKQRLQLLYPKRHELVIRESAKEFFIHLTVQLS